MFFQVHNYIFDSTVKKGSYKFLAEPDCSVLYTYFYAVFSGLLGKKEKLGGTVTDLQDFGWLLYIVFISQTF
jgi:hypothetical protein